MPRILSFLLAFFLVATALADDVHTISLRRSANLANFAGAARLSVADFDGDGAGDIFSCSAGAPFAVTRAGDGWSVSWMGAFSHCAAVTAARRDPQGVLELYLVTSDDPATLQVLDPRSQSPARVALTLPQAGVGRDVVVANVDTDAADEIVVVTDSDTYVFDPRTLTLEWVVEGYGGKRVEAGDVDGDGRKDIVINGDNDAWVFDGGTHALKFGYAGGFGSTFAVADVDDDGKAEIAFAEPGIARVFVLHADTMFLRTIEGSESRGVDAVCIGDANADGLPEIITGNNQWGSIEGRSPEDGSLLWSMSNPVWGVSGILAADLSGDGKSEVAWGSASVYPTSHVTLLIGDTLSQSVKWRFDTREGARRTAIADIDGDGRSELLDASGQYHRIEIFDVWTGAAKGRLSYDDPTSNVSFLSTGQLDADPALEVVALGAPNGMLKKLMVWDGVTRDLEFVSAGMDGYARMLVRNLDADAVDEIVLAGFDDRIVVLNGASAVIQASVPIDGSIIDATLADTNQDGEPELVYSTSSGVYLVRTSDWSLLNAKRLYWPRVIAATSAAGGTVAVLTYERKLQLYRGTYLPLAWTCPSSGPEITSLTFGALGGETYLFAGDSSGNIHRLSLAGDTCPAFYSTPVTRTSIATLSFVEATGDARPELLLETDFTSELALIGLGPEVRGDADGDGNVGMSDINTVVDFVFRGNGGLATAGDVDDDGRIGIEDAFQLIHRHFANSPVPSP